MTAIDFKLSELTTPPMPRRVWAGMVGLYAIVMIAMMTAGTPSEHSISMLSLVSMTIVLSVALTALMSAMLGVRGDASRIVVSALLTLVLSICVMLALQWGDQHDAQHADTSRLVVPWNWIAYFQYQATKATSFSLALTANVFGVAIFEETIKLLPAMVCFVLARGRSARGFMLAAAVGGLIFGVAESIAFMQLIYQREGAAPWVYVMRLGASTPAHAFWSAIGAAVACAMLNARCGRMVSLLSGWALACVLHGFHNATQNSIGPAAQVPSVFAAMLLLFIAVRWAWRSDLCRSDEPSRTMP
jgi:RsiW-degrading membrane proteinase PrsW (M82 family)